jgi:hypothetical protein
VAGTVAAVVGAIVALVAGIVLVTKGMAKLAASVREAAEASLEAKRKYAELVPAIASILSRKEVFELQERARRGRMVVPLAEAELQSYQRWTESTRQTEILGETLSVAIKVGFREALLPVMRVWENIAAALNKLLGIKEPKWDVATALGHPILRAFEFMRTGQVEQYFPRGYFRPRRRPPRPVNMGPGE